MSIFSTILQKLGFQKPPVTPPPAATPKPAAPAAPAVNVRPGYAGVPAQRPTQFTPPKPVEMPMVDVVSKLDGLAKKIPVATNWRQSINDLMAVLGMPHTPADIKELAVELGCPASEMDDSYKRNVWTHKELLKKIAENGGNIPANLLD